MEQTNEFLASLGREGRIDAPAPEKKEEEEKETPPAPPAENKPEEEKPPASPGGEGEEGKKEDDEKKPDAPADKGDDEEKLPFHKHPRWQALNNELNELREFREKVSPLLDRLGEKKDDHEEKTAIPAWFITLFGENQEAWNQYRQYDQDQRKALRTEIMHEFQQAERARSEEDKKWDKWVDTNLQRLADDGHKFDREKLLKVMLDYKPTGADGNLSFDLALNIYNAIEAKGATPPAKKPDSKKKDIADTTMQKGKNDEGAKKGFKTSADLQGSSFADVPRT